MRVKTAAILLGAAVVAGCAAFKTVRSDIATYGDWPAGRAPGTYAFDRLPSQQAQPEAAARLEDSARPALQSAGFREAAPGQRPQVLVQVAARSSRTDIDPWGDPLWWHGRWGYSRHAWGYPGWGIDMRFNTRYEREVALLIRDADSGKPLFEARASNEGASSGSDALQSAMFQAALVDFPRHGPNPRPVAVQLP